MNDRAQLIKELNDAGFHFHRTGKHTSVFRDAYGESIGIAHTPSDWRVLANQRALIKKAVAKRPPAPTEPIKEKTNVASNQDLIWTPPKQPGQDYVIAPSFPAPAAPPRIEPKDPAIVADRKQCKVCKEFKTLDNYRLAGPTRTPLKTCHTCCTKAAWVTRRKNKEAKVLVEMKAQAYDIGVDMAAVSSAHLISWGTTEAQFEDEANAATPELPRVPPIKNPDFHVSQRGPGPTPRPPARTRPNVIEQGEAETMAQRALVRRHRAEYDLILEDMMAALGWDK